MSQSWRRLVAGASLLVAASTVPPQHAAVAAPDPGAWLKPGVPITYEHPDPNIVDMGPLMFTYATNHGGADLPVLWSPDAKTWFGRAQYEGAAGQQDGDTYGWFNDAFPSIPWGIDYDRCDASTPACDPKELWAPSVAFIGGRWVGFHAVKTHREPAYSPYGRFAIFVSVAEEPTGPFRSASSQPIVQTDPVLDVAGAIDPDVFVDESSGRAFLLWKTEGNLRGNYPAIWSRELNGAGTGFKAGSTARKLITVSQGWEGTVVENPSMTKVGGRYVLLYSGNNYTTTASGTGYAICSGPTGPCTKSSTNPILRSVSGGWGPTGADGIVDQRGRYLAAYHAWTGASGTRGVGQRRQHIAELTVTTSGQIKVLRRDINNGAGGDYLWSHAVGGARTSTDLSVAGNYVPASGDFDGNGKDDVLWYGPWAGADTIWTGQGGGRFGSRAFDQRGALLPLTGDFNADGRDDIFWYGPGADPIAGDQTRAGSLFEANARNDELWLSTGTGWTKRRLGVTRTALPLVGDFDGNGASDIAWIRPGTASDLIWLFDRNGNKRDKVITVNGNYRPVVGDFDGDGIDDIFWYGPGAQPDSLWWFDANADYRSASYRATRDHYRPFAGDFDGDGRDDISRYAPGPAEDFVWSHMNRNGVYRDTKVNTSGIYQPVVGDYDGNGVDDILWYA